MFYPLRIPYVIKLLYRHCTWDMPSGDNKIYLSFDDGPDPEITAFVLDQLKEHGAKASFFCIGDNVNRYPGMYQRIIEEGHTIGNHTYHHRNGWKTSGEEYLANVKLARQVILSELFRPPYGRITYSQIRSLHEMGMRIVMWSLLSGDFDVSISPETCAKNVLNNMRPGDIVVFHDSKKASERLKYALPLVLEEISARGWLAEKLPLGFRTG